MGSERKPCGHCGAENVIALQTRNPNPELFYPAFFAVTCLECSSRGPEHKSIDEAHGAWNRRPLESAAEERGRVRGVEQSMQAVRDAASMTTRMDEGHAEHVLSWLRPLLTPAPKEEPEVIAEIDGITWVADPKEERDGK